MPQPPPDQFIQVDFEPVGRRTRARAGSSLLEVARQAGVELVSLCGGIGACDGCKVRLISGTLSPLTLIEDSELKDADISAGIRLACQAVPISDVKIYIPPASLSTPQRLQVEGREAAVDLEPVVIGLDVRLEPPSLSDLRADVTRLKDALYAAGVSAREINPALLPTLSQDLRAQDWAVQVAVRDGEIIVVLSPGSELYGLAVDVGTTKLAAYLVSLETGRTVAKAGAMNPQIAYGEDVISRIAYALQHAEGGQVLQATLVEALNALVGDLCAQAAVDRCQVVEAVAVGNTAMHHLLAGLPVKQLGLAPYVPAVSEPLDLRVKDIGLAIAPGAYLHLPPLIAGYVGSDHVAMLLASEAWHAPGTVIAIDIGTNTEISLVRGGQRFSCSCASGPAFEGAHIQQGMRAAPGAIERVQIEQGEVRIKTIGDQPPVGICGSGILDAVAELVRSRLLDRSGRFREGDDRLRQEDGNTEFVLVPAGTRGNERDIVISRKDINEIQLAKAAIRAGVEILMDRAEVTAAEVDQFIIAGAFGTYIDIASALRLGMFPPVPVNRFHQVGNAAGVGAKQMLISRARRELSVQIIRQIEYIELTTETDFSDRFLQAMFF